MMKRGQGIIRVVGVPFGSEPRGRRQDLACRDSVNAELQRRSGTRFALCGSARGRYVESMSESIAKPDGLTSPLAAEVVPEADAAQESGPPVPARMLDEIDLGQPRIRRRVKLPLAL